MSVCVCVCVSVCLCVSVCVGEPHGQPSRDVRSRDLSELMKRAAHHCDQLDELISKVFCSKKIVVRYAELLVHPRTHIFSLTKQSHTRLITGLQ